MPPKGLVVEIGVGEEIWADELLLVHWGMPSDEVVVNQILLRAFFELIIGHPAIGECEPAAAAVRRELVDKQEGWSCPMQVET